MQRRSDIDLCRSPPRVEIDLGQPTLQAHTPFESLISDHRPKLGHVSRRAIEITDDAERPRHIHKATQRLDKNVIALARNDGADGEQQWHLGVPRLNDWKALDAGPCHDDPLRRHAVVRDQCARSGL